MKMSGKKCGTAVQDCIQTTNRQSETKGISMRIALTGGIAAGKSTVSSRFEELGAGIVDYDMLSRQVVLPGSPALQRIVVAFGPESLNAEGELNRSWMASTVFAPGRGAERRRLESIIHPMVYEEAAKTEASLRRKLGHDGEPCIMVHEIPLFAEVSQSIPFSFEHVISVEAPVDERVSRMLNSRHMSQREAENRVRSQSSSFDREQVADIIIDSSQGLEQMFDYVDRIYKRLMAEDARRATQGVAD
jgi:dephospho-CoA kinase